MKTPLKWIVSLSICALAGSCFAQTYSPPPTSGTYRTNRMGTTKSETKSSNQSRTFWRSKDLVGATIKDSSGEKLGEIDEILTNPQKHETFASVDVGHGRYAIVPLQALNISPGHGIMHNAEVSLNATKESLQAGPTIADGEWQNLDSPSFTQQVYSHYNVQKPSAAGGTSDESLGGSSTGMGTSSTSTNKENEKTQP
jgi:PRC-barrel domain